MALLVTPAPDTTMKAPDFDLESCDGPSYTYNDIAGKKGTVVMFICNHCPYVQGIADRLPEEVAHLKNAGIGVVAIMPNDTESHPEDDIDHMKTFAHKHSFNFPYLIDHTQDVAKSFGAVCTPDFFGFDKNKNLVYRGRLDSAGHQKADPTTEPELRNAMLALAENQGALMTEQVPSMGCSIKWRE